MIKAAYKLSLKNLAIFPLQERSKEPWKGSRGFMEATIDGDKIKAWWEAVPKANIGLPTGKINGLLILDIDGPAGEESLIQMLIWGIMPPTLAVRTGKGLQYYFRYGGIDIHNSAGKLAKGIDVRGEGGYVVAPPSIHPNGQAYQWMHQTRFTPQTGHKVIEPAPQWLIGSLQLLEKLKSPTAAEWKYATAAIRKYPFLADPIERLRQSQPARPKAIRTTSDSHAHLLTRARMYIAKCDGVPSGARNQKVFAVAGHIASLIGRFGETLGEGDVLDVMREFNLRCKPPLGDKELVTAVRSAIRNGTPREPKPFGRRAA